MSSIDNNLGGGGGSASASGKKGAIQLSDGNFNLTSNKELKSDPKTGTITTTGLTTTGTVFAATVSATSLIVDTLTESLTVVGDASITGNATVDGTISTTKVDISGTLTTAWATVSGTLTATSITGTSANIDGEIKAGTLSSTGNGYFSSNVGIGTTDTAEYKFLVNDGTSNLFGVPLSSANLSAGKTLVYDGSRWNYDNAGGIVDGTQSGEILVWGGSEWSANSAVVVEGTSVGIGSTQPTQKLDVIGNVKATDFIGSGDALSDLNASNVTSGTLSNNRLPQTISVSNLEATANLYVTGPADITGTLSASSIIGSGAGISTLNASNITSGTLSNNRLPQTISVSNLEATANLVVGGPADITGTLSASSIIGSGAGISTLNASNITSGTLSNNRLPQTISVSNLEATANLVVDGPADITGTLSASSIIGSGAGISNLNASNITSGTLDNNRLPQTISVSNLEATANLVVGGPADITGTLSASSIIGSGAGISTLNASNITSGTLSNNRLPQTISVSNLEATANLVVGGPADITGTLSASSIIGSGAGISTLNASNITSGTLSNNRLPQTISVSNLEATANLVVGGPADITGTLSAAGIASSEDITVTGNNTLSASNIKTSNLTVTNSHNVLGNLFVSHTVSAPTLLVSKDAQVTGNLTVSGGVVTITTTTTGTSNIVITNAGTGPVLVATQLGAQPIANFIDGRTGSNVSALFISGGEQGFGRDGYVGLGTTEPAYHLDVRGDANVATNLFVHGTLSTSNIKITNIDTVTDNAFIGGTLSASNVETSNLTVTNRLSGGTISVSNVETSNLTVTNRLSGGTISVSNIQSSNLTVTNLNSVTNDAFIGGTLSASNIQSSNLTVTNRLSGGTISVSNVETSNLTVTNRLSGGTISVSNIQSSNLTVTNLNSVTNDAFIGGTLSASNIQSSNLTVTNLNSVTNDAFIGGTLSASNIQSSNLTVTNLNSVTNDAFIGGTLSASNVQSSNLTVTNRLSGGTISVSNVETSNLTVTNLNSVTNDAFIGGTLSASNIQSSNLTVTNLNSVTNDAFIGGTLSASNIQSSNLTVTNLNSVTNDAFIGGTLSASNIQSSNLTVTNLNSVTNDAFIGGTLSASNVKTSNLTVNGNTYISSNLGVGTADTAEYKFLVNDGTSNLFGVPYDTANLSTGKTIVYNGSGWVYDNAGPADGTQTGEILTWNGSEWSANSAVVVEGSNVGIGSTQPREILDVAGNVRITQSVLINETFQGRAMRLNDTPASNLHYQPNFTITGSLTSAGDIKTNQSFRGHNMFLSNVLTISGGVVTNTGTVNTTINGSLTVQGDAVVNSNISAVSVNTGDVISNRAVHGKAIRLGNTPESNVYYNPNLTVSGSLTAGGDVKSGTTFRGPDMVLSGTASVGTLSTSNITHGSELTITSNLLMGPGTTLTASNIVGASPVTISSNLVMASGYTLTAGAIEPPAGAESNLKITGTITTSNIVANTGDNLLVSSNLEVGTSNLFVDNVTGRVGIGVASPNYTLDVNGGVRTRLPWLYARNTSQSGSSTSYNVTFNLVDARDTTVGDMYNTSYACTFPVKGVYVVDIFTHSALGGQHTAWYQGNIRYSNGTAYHLVSGNKQQSPTTANWDTYTENTWVLYVPTSNMYLDLTFYTSLSTIKNYNGQWNRIRAACIYAVQ